ncbi:MAG: hypothetical protein ACQETH_07075 [Candidatus Rifleibacteriota bacterium]
MQNELNWQTAENEEFPMKLTEKGLDFPPKTAVFFYLSGIVAVLSMFWVLALSLKLIYMVQDDPTIPGYYKTIAIVCIAISVFSLFSFYKLYMNRRAYRKNIEIDNGMVNYSETTRQGANEWQEKLKKYEGVFLKHYSYRGVNSWYIALVHSDPAKSIPIFAPDYESRDIKEEEKKRILAQYGSKFGLVTHYESEEQEAKKA